MRRAGFSSCAFEVYAPDEPECRIAFFDHPMNAYRLAQDYRRLIESAVGARLRLVAIPR